MYPILFNVGNVAVHSYGVLGAVGFLVVCFVALRRAARLGLDKEKVADVIFWTAIAAVAGSRVFYIAQNPEQFGSMWDLVNIRTGGLVFYGALVPGLLVAAALMRRHKLPFFPLMDAFATGLPLGHAISRVGCVLAGCCYGEPTDLPWAITFTDPMAQAPRGIPLHPTQIYEVAYLLAIFGVVNYFYARKRFDGQVMLLYLTLYASARTLNEFLRGDATRGWFLEAWLGQVLSFSQGVSLVVAAAALIVFFVGARRAAAPPGPAAT